MASLNPVSVLADIRERRTLRDYFIPIRFSVEVVKNT